MTNRPVWDRVGRESFWSGDNLKSFASQTNAGALTGGSMMPGWGHLIGAVVGSGAAVGSYFIGDNKMKHAQ